VFVRTLSMDEGPQLQRIDRTAKDPVRLRRAIVVMMSGPGQSGPRCGATGPASASMRIERGDFSGRALPSARSASAAGSRSPAISASSAGPTSSGCG
jgi:hypothetical protein